MERIFGLIPLVVGFIFITLSLSIWHEVFISQESIWDKFPLIGAGVATAVIGPLATVFGIYILVRGMR